MRSKLKKMLIYIDHVCFGTHNDERKKTLKLQMKLNLAHLIRIQHSKEKQPMQVLERLRCKYKTEVFKLGSNGSFAKFVKSLCSQLFLLVNICCLYNITITIYLTQFKVSLKKKLDIF